MGNKTQKKARKPIKRGPGRPPKGEGRTSASIGIELLQWRLDQVTAAINDHPTASFSTAVAECAKRGVPMEVVENAFTAISECLQDAHEAMTDAYARQGEPKPTKAKPAPRANLLEVLEQ